MHLSDAELATCQHVSTTRNVQTLVLLLSPPTMPCDPSQIKVRKD